MRLRSSAAEGANRPELAGPLAPADRPGGHRAPAREETIAAAQRSEAVKPQSLERVSVDTIERANGGWAPLLAPIDQPRRSPIPCWTRASTTALGETALRLASRYAHARQMKRARREIAGRPKIAEHFALPLVLVARLLAQQRTDKNKLYALHSPEVTCIAPRALRDGC